MDSMGNAFCVGEGVAGSSLAVIARAGLCLRYVRRRITVVRTVSSGVGFTTNSSSRSQQIAAVDTRCTELKEAIAVLDAPKEDVERLTADNKQLKYSVSA